MSIRDLNQKRKLEKLKRENPIGYLEKAINEVFGLYKKISIELGEEIVVIKNSVLSLPETIETRISEVQERLRVYIDIQIDEKRSQLLTYLDQRTDTVLEKCIVYLKEHPAPKGDSYTLSKQDKEEIAKNITVPVVEKVIEKNTVVERVTPIIQNVETTETIIEKLNQTKETVAVYVIRGLQEELENIKRTIRRQNQIHGGGTSAVGATAFTALTDTPSSYAGQAEKIVRVKSTEDGLEFVPNINDHSKTLTFNADGSLDSCTDSTGSETIVYTLGIPSSVIGTGVYVNKTFTYTDTLDAVTL